MKKILILFMLIFLTGKAFSQTAVTITLYNTNVTAVSIQLYALCPFFGDYSGCDIISDAIILSQSSPSYIGTDACYVQTTTGWYAFGGTGPLSCPSIPASFQWTDADFDLKFINTGACGCTGCTTDTTADDPSFSTCFSEATAVSGYVGTCSYTIQWSTTMSGISIGIF